MFKTQSFFFFLFNNFFSDLKHNSFTTATNNTVVEKINSNLFQPENPITRVQINTTCNMLLLDLYIYVGSYWSSHSSMKNIFS